MCSGAWTPFSFFFIIGFILMMCLVLLIDRFAVIWLKKSVWIVEIVLIMLALIYIFKLRSLF